MAVEKPTVEAAERGASRRSKASKSDGLQSHDAVDELKGHDLAPGEAAALAGLRTVELGLDADQVDINIDPKEEARILRKVDYRLVPLLAFLYL